MPVLRYTKTNKKTDLLVGLTLTQRQDKQIWASESLQTSTKQSLHRDALF